MIGMFDIYIWGLGKGKKYLDRCILSENITVCGYIDNYKADDNVSFDGCPVISQNDLDGNYDFVIITMMEYESARQTLISTGADRDKIICFFDFKDADNEKNWKVIDSHKWRTELMWKNYTEVLMPSVANFPYEIYADSELIRQDCPNIMDVDSTVEKLITEKKCLTRFGDGEFEIMCGRNRAPFQTGDERLADCLKDALHSRQDNLLVAIADNYGSLEKYTDDGAKGIRMYLTPEVRKEHMALLDLNRQYYDAYLSRPYLIYRDKQNAGRRFEHIKKLWDQENVLIVEGELTRFGVGNDLLDNAGSIERIVVPSQNAFEKYDEIRKEAVRLGRGKLILVIMGPAATVLAYDLAKLNYWIVDIGQLDTEYEWYLRGTEQRCAIRYKGVSEVVSYDKVEYDEENEALQKYAGQIIKRIL
jgi:glycosyltransferase family protein